MTELKERDAMECRACGGEERASEGYPCTGCGTFICLLCTMRGVVLCRTCAAKAGESGAASGAAPAA
jgi:hypothetical protein